ncbi:FMN-binding negative transcriptional regulator [Janibacter melonis]|uniref:FMN-binding negative transcriptional regulator n=1 Tax=Janibacter melonis TaxID=262209 RepID=UPI001782BD8B|nr:FMN-binding negative transcriptional regulator [Janibacter melonis]
MPYLPPHDEVTDPAVLAPFVARHPLAALVTHDGTTPDVDLVPLLLLDDADGRRLVGHVARANPLWRPGRQEGPVMATFGPAEHYVSPTWYPSKAVDHRVVPTWNYLVVHGWGELVVHDDPRWVRGVLARLTTAMESGREQPWRMGMAPADYLDARLGDVVGVEIPLTRLVGRFKVSAARSDADRLGAHDGIAGEGGGRAVEDLLAAMADPPQRAAAPRDDS